MFGWFKKQPQTVDPRDWVNMQGEGQQGPLYVRLRQSLADPRVQRAHDHQVMVIFEVVDLDERGLPATEAELTALDDWEERCKKLLERGGKTVLALIVTGNGTRTLHFYTSDPSAAIRCWEQELQPAIHDRRTSFDVLPDAEWEAYRCFAG
jgi:hypothetical protein